MYRVVVTGGSDLPEAEIVWIPLWLALHRYEAIIVTHGACGHGADRFAQQWFTLPDQTFNRKRRRYENGTDYLAIEDPHRADWSKGKIGGAIRNQEMIDTKPDVVFSFPTPKTQGTWDCMARAWLRDIPVYIWDHLTPAQCRQMTDDEGERLARRKLGFGR